MKQKFYIDSHKISTGIFILVCMAIYDQWNNSTAWIYLALHGSYGVMWFLKSRIFPDKAWEVKIPLWYGIVNWMGLSLYWVAPFLIMYRGVDAPGWLLGLSVAMNVFGVFAHFASDMQKYTSLMLEPGELIEGGLFVKVRNINYFGEFLIYLSFALLAIHCLPILILGLWIAFIWLPNMGRKDKSLARYARFEAYKKRTKLFIPYLY